MKDERLLSAPFETEESVLKYEIEIPFDVPDRIFYLFADKPFADYKDVVQINLSHEEDYFLMLENAKSCFDQPEAFIREINRIIVKSVRQNGGQYRTEEVSLAGVDFMPPQASSVPAFMRQLGEEIKRCGFDRSPLEFATSLHTKLVWIHPFIDGNGRTARLLLNACLLAQGLPVVIVNYADRERYLDCLCESNKGNLSSMVDCFLECFEQQLEGFAAEVTPTPLTDALLDATVAAPSPLPESEIDEIDQAIQEVIIMEVDNPLTTVMKQKVLEQDKIRQADYDAWKQSFLTISAELKALVEFFSGNHKYTQAGFKIKFREYDLLTFDKYADISKGRRATKTWFVGLEISGPHSRERILLFFTRASGRIIQEPKANKVSLIVSRFDGSRYQLLDSEPIGLREIGYQDGKLLFLSHEGIMPVRGVRQILNSFLADIIKSYL